MFFLMIRRPPRSTRTAHSFPTLRSSDLPLFIIVNPILAPGMASLRRFLDFRGGNAVRVLALASQKGGSGKTTLSGHLAVQAQLAGAGPVVLIDIDRSEEHTSELQSLMRISYAVFCLKQKKQRTNHKDNQNNSPN